MHVTVIGTGYVGLVSGAGLADFGHAVCCVDQDADRTATLAAGVVPFHEPGLAELVAKNVAAGRLTFSTNLPASVATAGVVFLTVGTPPAADGSVDLTQITAAAAEAAPWLRDGAVVAIKSTVPVGTGARVEPMIRRLAPEGVTVDFVSNPEFLREGAAVGDFMRPDRVVIGTRTERAWQVMRELYRPLYLIETPIVHTTVETAELIKYAANAFLAVKIGFANEMANLCDQVGADVHIVAKAMGLDRRIGPKFLHAGPGYGGSCFPKDTRALAVLGAARGAPQRIVEAAIAVNARQRQLMLDKVLRTIDGVVSPAVAVLGLAFKPNTSDVRESPALFLCEQLAEAGVTVRAYDPVAMDEARAALAPWSARIELAADAYDAAAGADVLVVVTEWNEFRNLDLPRIHRLLRRRSIVDARNVLDPAAAVALGFDYFCTGRQVLTPLGASHGPMVASTS